MIEKLTYYTVSDEEIENSCGLNATKHYARVCELWEQCRKYENALIRIALKSCGIDKEDVQ